MRAKRSQSCCTSFFSWNFWINQSHIGSNLSFAVTLTEFFGVPKANWDFTIFILVFCGISDERYVQLRFLCTFSISRHQVYRLGTTSESYHFIKLYVHNHILQPGEGKENRWVLKNPADVVYVYWNTKYTEDPHQLEFSRIHLAGGGEAVVITRFHTEGWDSNPPIDVQPNCLADLCWSRTPILKNNVLWVWLIK